MRDGQPIKLLQIQLQSHTQKSGVVFYNFEINLNSKKILLSERYSKLCQLAQQLPKTNTFPPKISFGRIKNLFFNKKNFVNERFSQLKKYFQNEKIIEALKKNKQFLQKLEQLDIKQNISQRTLNCKPRGKKLQLKQLNTQNQYILI